MVMLGCGTWPTSVVAGEPREGGEQQLRVIESAAAQFEFTPSEIQVSVVESERLVVRSIDVEPDKAIQTLGIGEKILSGGELIPVDFVIGELGRYRTSSMLTGVAANAGVAQPTVGPDSEVDLVVDVLEPNFALILLPTTRRMPHNKFAFRLTHRSSRPLNGGARFGNLFEDFFGFDSSALIGLELRYGLLPGTQVGFYRSNSKNIQIFARQNLLGQRGPYGIGLDVQVSIEGGNNFRGRFNSNDSRELSGSVAGILSKSFGEWASVYVEPTWVGNVDKPGRFHPSVDDDDDDADDDNAFMLGLGARLRVRPTVYLIGEYAPRLGGFDDGAHHLSFAIEKRAGGHTFQLNFSNSLGTTPAQMAQGGSKDDWFIGFNIARKFF